MIYDLLYRYLLVHIDAERAHQWAFTGIRLLARIPGLRKLAAAVLRSTDPVLASTVMNIHFPAPLGLAAGFDKDARGVNAWYPMGFGYAEVGTVTAVGQPGNPAPRLFRLPADHALLNRMGFNNHGAGFAANELRRRRTSLPIGVNIGKTKAVPASDPGAVVADYVASARLLAPLANYLVVNVSSPNTPGLRDLQSVDSLRPILAAVQGVTDIPVLVKIAPDLADTDIDAVADLAVELGLAGIVATNTTISRAGLTISAAKVDEMGAGGISGEPVAQRSLEVLRRLYARVGNDLVLISVGGIDSAEDAYARILAGASLLQGYSAYVYRGPLWPRRVHRGLARLLRAGGYASVSDAVGTG